MNCPTCPSSTLVIADRSGIEIDYCPTCRGVWLDRGELDKLIERSDRPGGEDRRTRAVDRERRHRDWDGDDDWVRHGDDGGPGRRRRRSMLGELFDF